MIAVITDDLTGAAEIAGSALARGFRSVIKTRSVDMRSIDIGETDVLVIATNMRSLDAESAARKSALLTEQIKALKPEIIFKKVDSVLRGNVGPELAAQMDAEGKSRALLIPANPSQRRTILNGTYFVGDQPVAQSGFAESHDFASKTSNVVEILANGGAANAICISPSDAIDRDGLFIGNTQNHDDLHAWAKAVNSTLVPAGGVDFFSAILELKSPSLSGRSALGERHPDGKALYVCGSNFPTSRAAICKDQDQFVCIEMPDEVYFSAEIVPELLDCWAKNVLDVLSENENVVITATQKPNGQSLDGRMITQAMAEVAKQVVASGAISDLMIEGGATSQAVLGALNIDSLYPTDSLALGVTRMRVDEYPQLHVTTKPGSYRWPDSIWNTNT
jgi:uncharacterized protein YgbK (DUF1537 family)